jgi:hypothetical protein
MLKRSNESRRPGQAQRVFEPGLAINGELRVQLFGLNLLPIRVRLLVSSMDVAAGVGLNWWNDGGTRSDVEKSPAAGRERNGRRHGSMRNGKRSQV